MKEKFFINNAFNFTDATSPLTWNKILKDKYYLSIFLWIKWFFLEIFALIYVISGHIFNSIISDQHKRASRMKKPIQKPWAWWFTIGLNDNELIETSPLE